MTSKKAFCIIELIASILIISIVTSFTITTFKVIDNKLSELIELKNEYEEKLEEYRNE